MAWCLARTDFATPDGVAEIRRKNNKNKRSDMKHSMESRPWVHGLATLALLDAALAQPNITTQPKDSFLDPGKGALFSVTVLGTPPLSYRWFHNDALLANATNRMLRLTNVQPNFNGDYVVVVTDSSGSVTSRVARLKVFVPTPHRFTQLQLDKNEGATFTLAGEATAFFARYSDLYPVEASPNLTDWYPLATLQRANTGLAPLRFSDANASQFTQRFYRTPTNLFLTAFPKPTGPFPVGTFSRVIRDPARPNAYRYNNRTNAFMLTCWYPAEPQAGLLPVPAWDAKVAADSARYSEFSEDTSWASVVTQFHGHALPEAPIARGADRYPIILYSHGYTCHRKINCHDVEELASHGYVVVGVDHEDCWGTEFPDGRYLKSSYNANSFTAGLYLTESRIKDLLFVMHELRRMDVDDPWLEGRLDLEAIGTLGMSFGGSPTASLCRTNDAVKCAAFLDCAFHFEVNVDLLQMGIQKPFLAMNNDYTAYQPLYFWPESTRLFDLANSDAVIFQIQNTWHFSFFDFGWFFLDQPTASRLMDACLVSFFNRYLKGQDDHFLDQTPPSYPEEPHEVLNFKHK